MRIVAVLAIAAVVLGMVPPLGAQSADGLDGNTFTSKRYRWSVTFDDGFWKAEELDESEFQGVRLTGDGAVANLRVFDDGITDTGDCLDTLLGRFTTDGEDVDNLERANDLDPPATAPNAESRLYAGTLTSGDDPIDAALYLECREVVDGTLAVDITIPEETYDAIQPDVEALLAGITTFDPSEVADASDEDETPTPDAEPSASDDATPATDDADAIPATDDDEPTPDSDAQDETPAADESAAETHDDEDRLGEGRAAAFDDDSYASRLGYAITYDPDVVETTSDDGSRGVALAALEEELTVSVLAFEDPSIDDCVDREVATVMANPDNASVSRSGGTRLPATADDASGVLLRVTEDTTRQARLIVYVECRPLADEGEGGDPSFVVVRAISGEASFRRTRALIEDLLAGLSLADDSASDEETPVAGDGAPADTAITGETDLDAGVFVGETNPFRLEWDTAYWVGAESDVGVTLTAVDGASFLSVEQYSAGPGSGFTEAGCVLGPLDDFSDVLPDLDEYTPAAGQAIAWPERVGNTQSAGTRTFDDGSTATQIVAVGCLELTPAQRYLRFIFSTVDVVYPVSVAELNDILASLVVDESATGATLMAAGGVRDGDPPAAVSRRNTILPRYPDRRTSDRGTAGSDAGVVSKD